MTNHYMNEDNTVVLLLRWRWQLALLLWFWACSTSE